MRKDLNRDQNSFCNLAIKWQLHFLSEIFSYIFNMDQLMWTLKKGFVCALS
jgi:hypothetical protein